MSEDLCVSPYLDSHAHCSDENIERLEADLKIPGISALHLHHTTLLWTENIEMFTTDPKEYQICFLLCLILPFFVKVDHD